MRPGTAIDAAPGANTRMRGSMVPTTVFPGQGEQILGLTLDRGYFRCQKVTVHVQLCA